ncbi:N-acetylmuramoyl-L-alanine amidase [Streptomyces sp. NBC_01214]|uniref:N-acetylmuramoyl-L-alanine amidase n=1 Tax=Streptomyces sp. NBC_01214 TaxID=2903777 RepID=UPI00225841E2|nr:N-acetylmuramoyl-L-alanine amidase [Streptomyces sp. NBC_01214]MCX4801795.1 N-acetylmuramoyl-L-alanine amidase [Streptomyces sp. NBC_01214]
MAWYPGAIRMELQPESDNQPAIKPTQFIMHSIAAPWSVRRTYEYWRDSTNLESHFGLDYVGQPGQYIGTQTRADANYKANLRPDGTGAVSIETASNDKHTDPWSSSQVEELIKLGVWLHQQHGIPLRICRTASDPGYGYHRLHADWAVGGTDCPGDARVAQFKNVIFPAIVARANGQTPEPPQQEDIVTPAEIQAIATAVWNHPLPNITPAGVEDGQTKAAFWLLVWQDYAHKQLMDAIAASKLTPAQITAALADGTLKVKVTVEPAATPKAV